VFTPEFAAQCERVLAPGGRLHVATDVADYFTVIADLLAGHTRLRRQDLPDPPGDANGGDALTNFEHKFRLQGRPIHRAAYDKQSE
jgi:tRNA (guanine-N7-)-methyltransferase